MPVVWSDRCRLHEPRGEVWVGVRTSGTEVPQRVDAIRAALLDAGGTIVDADEHPDEALLAVHDAELLTWEAARCAGGDLLDRMAAAASGRIFPLPRPRKEDLPS